MNGDNEINLAHATVPQNFLTSTVNGTSQQWIKRPFAIGAKSPETHQWAPYVIQHPLSGFSLLSLFFSFVSSFFSLEVNLFF